MNVTVATWNVKHFTYDPEKPAHAEKLDNIARDIVRAGADIVVLQEVSCQAALLMHTLQATIP